MKIKTLIALMLLVPLVIGSVAYAQDPLSTNLTATSMGRPVVTALQDGGVPEQFTMAPDSQQRIIGLYGLNWFPEKPGKFAQIKRNTKGTKTRVNTPGYYYVDISVPLIPYEDFSTYWILKVEFCGQSSKGAKTKPVKLELWGDRSRFFYEIISWPANEDVKCVAKSFSHKNYSYDLLLRVYVKYHNTTHTFTFKNVYAWLRR